jgi:multidrug resistance efflux pump
MERSAMRVSVVIVLFAVAAALVQPVSAASVRRQLRATGTTRALKQLVLLTPQIAGQVAGQSGRLTLVSLAPSGTRVKQGDVVAEFDKTQQLDTALDVKAKYEDFGHQVAQKRAENRANAEKRAEEMQQALAELGKAELQRRKGPVLSEIERLKNEVKLADAQARVESLKKSHQARQRADAAALRILELKQERQKVILERTERNVQKLALKAPHDGVVALENTWRNGSMGPPQEGDQMYPGQAVLRVFDPREMEVHTMVGEPDGAVLAPGAKALVRLDAYPEVVLEARLVAASPVAASALGLPIKKFAARFRLEKTDPRVLPDLSAAVIILGQEGTGGAP